MDDIKLPPLPDPEVKGESWRDEWGYEHYDWAFSETQMHEYARAALAAAPAPHPDTADAQRYRWLLSQLAGMKRAEFFEPLRQHFYDTDEKYPDADDVQAAIDAAMLERVGVGAA